MTFDLKLCKQIQIQTASRTKSREQSTGSPEFPETKNMLQSQRLFMFSFQSLTLCSWSCFFLSPLTELEIAPPPH